MAKDLVDTMLEMILQFFKWIVKILVKLTVGLIKFLFDVIKAFFSGNKKQGTVSRTDNEDQPEKLWLYDDFISDMNALKSKFSGEELSNQSLKLVVNLLVNFNISAEDKCRGLQESKAIVKEACNNDSFSIITFWSKSITASYTILEGMVAQPAAVTRYKQEFNEDLSTSNLKPLREYLVNIISISGAIAASGESFTFDGNLLSRYSLPQWVD